MILAFVGSGGKTTLLKNKAAEYRAQGKTVLITPSTHMFVEKDSLLTDDADTIIRELKENGFVMAGNPDGIKLKPLSEETFRAVCPHADVVLVEADGSRMLPLKFPNATEPVIPDNTDEIFVVCGLNAIGQRAKDCCHRLELVKACLGIEEDTIITPAHVQILVREGYLKPLAEKHPRSKITPMPRHNGSAEQMAIARTLVETWEAICRNRDIRG